MKLIKIEAYVSHLKIFVYSSAITILIIVSIFGRFYLHKWFQKSWDQKLRDISYILPYFNISISAALFICGLYTLRECQNKVNINLFCQGILLFENKRQSLNSSPQSNIKMIESHIRASIKLLLEIHIELSDLYHQLNGYFKISNLLILFSVTSLTVVEIYFLVWSYKIQSVSNMYTVRAIFFLLYNEILFQYILHLANCCLLQVSIFYKKK